MYPLCIWIVLTASATIPLLLLMLSETRSTVSRYVAIQDSMYDVALIMNFTS